MINVELVLTILALALLWIGCLVQSRYELMAPVPLMVLGMLIAGCFALLGVLSWNHVAIRWEVAAIVIVGSLSLFIGAVGGNLIFGKIHPEGTNGELEASTAIYSTSIWKYVIIALILVTAIIVRVVETYRIGAELGVDLTSFSEVVNAVREATASYKNPDSMLIGTGFSLLERQLDKVATVTGYVCAGLIAINLVNRKNRQAAGMLVLLALSCAFCFVTGSRASIAYYVIALLIVLFICLIRKGNDSKELSIRFFIACVIVAIFGAMFFYFGVALVGRKASSGLVEYISFYYGGGLPSLQSVLDMNVPTNIEPGIRTFYYLFSIPYKFGVMSDYPSYSIAWVDMGGHASNIFTGFARFYLDFGFLGVMLLSAVTGAILTLIWKIAACKGTPLLLILIGFLGAQAFDFAREEFIFSRLLSLNQLASIVIMGVITLFLSSSLKGAFLELRKIFAGKVVKD